MAEPKASVVEVRPAMSLLDLIVAALRPPWGRYSMIRTGNRSYYQGDVMRIARVLVGHAQGVSMHVSWSLLFKSDSILLDLDDAAQWRQLAKFSGWGRCAFWTSEPGILIWLSPVGPSFIVMEGCAPEVAQRVEAAVLEAPKSRLALMASIGRVLLLAVVSLMVGSLANAVQVVPFSTLLSFVSLAFLLTGAISAYAGVSYVRAGVERPVEMSRAERRATRKPDEYRRLRRLTIGVAILNAVLAAALSALFAYVVWYNFQRG